MRMRRVAKFLIFLLQSVTVGLAVAFVVVYLHPELLDNGAGGASAPGSYAQAVQRTAPAVVNVHTARRVVRSGGPLQDDPFWRRYFGDNPAAPPDRIKTSLGSGVIVSTDGYILTNNHVIEGADEIQVALNDGRAAAAKVVGVDPDTDLALLKIDLDGLTPIELGRSDTLAVGDVVLAIGDPFGVGQTVTQGIISAVGRSQLGLSTFENFIQTDAAINPGNSGGALVNARGELVGINTANYSPSGASNGIGFAIPVNLARGVMEELIKYGRVLRGWLGIEPQSLTPELAEALGTDATSGIVVTRVLPGPAARAGIHIGDIITAIDGKSIATTRQALTIIASRKPGTKVTIVGLRHGQEFKVTVAVAERPLQRSS
jgi:Do/DeqQ family serine protease